eukprot:sb/3475243/
MKKLRFNPDPILTPTGSSPGGMGMSRTAALDSFKYSYARAPKSSRGRNKSADSLTPQPQHHHHREFSKLREPTDDLAEKCSTGEDDDDQANDAETEQLMKIKKGRASKGVYHPIPTDVILHRHIHSGT